MNQELSEDQRTIFDSYKYKENIFITGPGGCGKSFLIKKILNDALENKKKISITAMTGCASILLGKYAKTLHSWAGIGIANKNDDIIATQIELNTYKKQNWLKTEILIIDEVSMMSKRLFNLLDYIGKKVRKSSKPFGGIQVIFCGDFYQLPPVGNEGDIDSFKFCFQSELWDETFDSQYILDKTYRQTDEDYINILNQIREGKLNNYYFNILKKRVNLKYNDNMPIKPVILHPTKKSVDIVNQNEMDKLNSEEKKIRYRINLLIPEIVEMKEMLELTNIENEMIDNENILQKINYLEKNGLLAKLNSKIKQDSPKYPNIKQLISGLFFIQKNTNFQFERTYKIGAQVMCTKNIDLETGIYNGSVGIIKDIKENMIFVRFNNGSEKWISYHSTQIESLPQVEFQQIPLILAWGITIHKSQGATLDYAEIDVGSSIFAEGQTYVALSRVRSLDGLYLKSLDKQKIKVNSDVIKFYEKFYE
jgi:ATP-dependent DNA helicase PIF1